MEPLIQQIDCSGECIICICPHLGVICVNLVVSLLEIFICTVLFASHFWLIFLEAFRCSLTFPNNVYDILASILVGQSFCGIRKLLWLTIVQAFFRHLWGGRNGRIFRDVSSFDWSMDMVLFTAFLWCKNKHQFALYNLSYLISNLRSLL